LFAYLHADFCRMLIFIMLFAKVQKVASFIVGGQAHQRQI